MRTFDLTTEIPSSRDRAWQRLVRLEDWPRWNTILPWGVGEVRPGAVLDLRMLGRDGRLGPHRPTVVSVRPPEEVVLAAAFGHRGLLRMVHSLALDDLGPSHSRLRQRWTVTGLLVPWMWPSLARAMTRFEMLGSDLAAWVQSPD